MRTNTLRQRSDGRSKKAFALPTVLIASTVMLAVLSVTLASVQSGIVIALDSSHYERYANNAAKSGIVMAKACLKESDYVASWTSSSLKPNTNCSGVVQGGLSAYIHNDTAQGVRSTFTVDPPTVLANGVLRLTVTSTSERLRDSGATFRTYTKSTYASISSQASFSSVAFGYQSSGAFFGVIDPQGGVTSVGYNGNGQLGNATTTNSATPQSYRLPPTLRATQLHTNFLSVGFTMFAVTSDGQLYGSGSNGSGQLGNGAMTSAQSTPVKFQLPAGVKASYVAPGVNFTYVIGDDNNVYSAGACAAGALGYSYAISGCTDQSTYRRLTLPAVNVSDLNTLPVATSDWVQSTNIATDRLSAYVRMQGGRVYGWGDNHMGQLGNGTFNASSIPVQVTTLGNVGQPKATQVSFDGSSVWILDDTGNVWASGRNDYGTLGAASPIGSGSGKCLDNPNNSTTSGTLLAVHDCNNTIAQQFEWAEDGTLKLRPNTTTERCIDNSGSSSAEGNPILIYSCNGTTAQKWSMTNDGKIRNPATGKCINNPANSATNGTKMVLNSCNLTAGFPDQTWTLRPVVTPAKVLLPAGHGVVSRITTDQESTLFLMTDGTIWGYGLNNAGQLGSGNLLMYNPKMQQYVLPAGRTAVNFYTSKTGIQANLQFANTFAVLDDGSVYGSGANTFGQLGNGTTSLLQASTPVKMTLPAGVRAQTVQSGLGSTIILTDEGRIYTVGNNANGQLGDGTTTNSSIPLMRQYVNTRPIVLY